MPDDKEKENGRESVFTRMRNALRGRRGEEKAEENEKGNISIDAADIPPEQREEATSKENALSDAIDGFLHDVNQETSLEKTKENEQTARGEEQASKDNRESSEHPLSEIPEEAKGVIRLPAAAAEQLQENFAQMHCPCEIQDTLGEKSIVSFDKTDAETFLVLQESFPAVSFPFEKWGKQAEDMGKENPYPKFEELLEDDADMFDGIVNNSTKEKEAEKAKESPEKASKENAGRVTFSRKERAEAKEQLDTIHQSQGDTAKNKDKSQSMGG